MIIKYEIGDSVERIEYYESQSLLIKELREDGVVVEVKENKYGYEDFKDGKFLRFIDIRPSSGTIREARLDVNGKLVSPDLNLKYQEAVARDLARRAAAEDNLGL